MEKADIKLIGLAGNSCSGKTTLATELKRQLGNNAARLSFDDYYIPRSQRKDPSIPEESPQIYDMNSFVRDLKLLKNGQTISSPANSRESGLNGIKSIKIQPKKIVLVDGYLIFHDPRARKLFDSKIFVEIPEGEIVRRRKLRRDPVNPMRHDTDEYIEKLVIPNNQKYIQPQKKFADAILDGTEPTAKLVEKVRSLIQE
ncbi:MAG TPA: hypothetical protein VF189_03320 [Patescibacteria group bacterium]